MIDPDWGDGEPDKHQLFLKALLACSRAFAAKVYARCWGCDIRSPKQQTQSCRPCHVTAATQYTWVQIPADAYANGEL